MRRSPSGRSSPAGGAVRFARYAYPPNALGYCGPPAADTLLEAATGEPDASLLRHLAEGFEGAWPYLQLIAACNQLDDPLDEQVVEAYWVGNHLLDRVPPRLLVASLDDRFARRAGPGFTPIAEAVLAHRSVAHHSFHVFAVYPWVGLLRAGRSEGPALRVLDRCRIRSGVVQAVTGGLVVVRSRPLQLVDGRLVLGAARDETARQAQGEAGLATTLVPGTTVSLHWDWVCERLSPAGEARLERATDANLAAVNALSPPGRSTRLERRLD